MSFIQLLKSKGEAMKARQIKEGCFLDGGRRLGQASF